MKYFKRILVLFVIVFITSCSPITYYQVYKISTDNKLKSGENFLIYNDENISLFYNFWSEGGTSGFKLYNKSENDIYLIIDETFFILNNHAVDYFKGTNDNENFLQNALICIPSKTYKYFDEFKINEILIRNCELLQFPSVRDDVITSKYSISDSPIRFSNRITYQLGKGGSIFKFENSFYVSEITNYPEYKMFKYEYNEFCGEKEAIKTKIYKYASFDKFYIKYVKGYNRLKH